MTYLTRTTSRVLPWERDYNPLDEPMPPMDALDLLQPVELKVVKPRIVSPYTGEEMKSDDLGIVVRSRAKGEKGSQNGVVMGKLVSSDYEPITPGEGMTAWDQAFLDDDRKPHKVHTIGYTKDYSRMFAVATLEESEVVLHSGKKQRIGNYGMYWNPLEPQQAVSFMHFTVVVVCMNGMIGQQTSYRSSLMHTRNAKKRITDLFSGAGKGISDSISNVKEIGERLSGIRMDSREFSEIAEQVFRKPPTPRKNIHAISTYDQRLHLYNQALVRRNIKFNAANSLFSRGPDGAQELGFEQTAWAALQTFTQLATHSDGKGDRLKQMIDSDRYRIMNDATNLIMKFSKN